MIGQRTTTNKIEAAFSATFARRSSLRYPEGTFTFTWQGWDSGYRMNFTPIGGTARFMGTGAWHTLREVRTAARGYYRTLDSIQALKETR